MTRPQPLFAPFDEAQTRRSVDSWAAHLKVGTVFKSRATLEFALVPPGEYTRGTSESDRIKYLEIYRKMGMNFYDDGVESSKAIKDFQAAHRVIISHAMYVSRYEVTEAQFVRLMKSPELRGKASDKLPVGDATWFDAVSFCNSLSHFDGLPEYYNFKLLSHSDNDGISDAEVSIKGGSGYRLLTEAEWEYACRAGTETLWHFGDLPDSEKAHIVPLNLKSNPKNHFLPVGSFPPNSFGLHDMHGNAQEWCYDHWPDTPDYARYTNGRVIDPVVATGDLERIIRGMTYQHGVNSRSAQRSFSNPSEPAAGIRVCRTIPVPAE